MISFFILHIVWSFILFSFSFSCPATSPLFLFTFPILHLRCQPGPYYFEVRWDSRYLEGWTDLPNSNCIYSITGKERAKGRQNPLAVTERERNFLQHGWDNYFCLREDLCILMFILNLLPYKGHNLLLLGGIPKIASTHFWSATGLEIR